MMINFSFHWQHDNSLLESDASLSLGWIELQIEENKFNLFEKKLCMVFITISDLLDTLALSTNQKRFNWVGVDGGEVYKLERKKEIIILDLINDKLEINFLDFKKALISSSEMLLNYSKSINFDIEKEAAFNDLRFCLELLKKGL